MRTAEKCQGVLCRRDNPCQMRQTRSEEAETSLEMRAPSRGRFRLSAWNSQAWSGLQLRPYDRTHRARCMGGSGNQNAEAGQCRDRTHKSQSLLGPGVLFLLIDVPIPATYLSGQLQTRSQLSLECRKLRKAGQFRLELDLRNTVSTEETIETQMGSLRIVQTWITGGRADDSQRVQPGPRLF